MRRRITLLAAATALLAVLLLSVPLGLFVGHGYVTDERLELQRSAASVAASLRGDRLAAVPRRLQHADTNTTVYGADGARVAGPPQTDGALALVRDALAGTETTGDLRSGLAVAAPISDGDQVVAAVVVSSDLHDAHRRALWAWLIIAAIGLVAVLVSAVAARFVAARLARPLERLRDGARRMGEGDLEVRAPLSGVAEFDTLATTLNDSATRLQSAMTRERSLSAEVSHQLRTPLSGLRLELEVLRKASPDSDGLASAMAAVDQLAETITDVIALARDLPLHQRSPVDELLAGVHRRWHGRLAAATRPLRTTVEPGAPAEIALSAAAATQILDVLLANALQHGRGAVAVHVRDASGAVAVDVRDEGPALTVRAHELFRVRDARRGSGIGLPFARRLAEAENARLSLTSHDPPTFTLLVGAAEPD